MATETDKTDLRKVLYERPGTLQDVSTHYCSGCGHGIAHRLIAEVLEEMGLRERAIGVAPVGCAVLAYDYLDIDWTEAPHGRPPAIATAIKRLHPDALVFTYQGDGDLASIGMAETIHAANRGENISVIFINNTVYAMTQGQMAPTTLAGQKTTTTPRGRNVQEEGYPMHVCELLNQLQGPAYLVRTTLGNPRRVRETKRCIRKAFQYQMDGVGYSLVEVLSPCPTYWRMAPAKSMAFLEETVTGTFPVGVVRDLGAEG
jgi:2-oxoglutarate ferredoxin oxidoreductase subunit beta